MIINDIVSNTLLECDIFRYSNILFRPSLLCPRRVCHIWREKHKLEVRLWPQKIRLRSFPPWTDGFRTGRPRLAVSVHRGATERSLARFCDQNIFPPLTCLEGWKKNRFHPQPSHEAGGHRIERGEELLILGYSTKAHGKRIIFYGSILCFCEKTHYYQ